MAAAFRADEWEALLGWGFIADAEAKLCMGCCETWGEFLSILFVGHTCQMTTITITEPTSIK